MEELGFKVWLGEELHGKEKPGFDVTISKIHPTHNAPFRKAEKVFTSYRNIGDVAESWYRFNGKPVGVELLDKWIWWLLEWVMHPEHAYHMWYQDFLNDRPLVIKAHLDVLDPRGEVKIQTVLDRLVQEVVPPKEGYDPKTCLFSNHITKP